MAKSDDNGHDARGRFKRKNDCARSRRQVRMEREYLAALSSVVSLNTGGDEGVVARSIYLEI